jgi:hypothetical protein
MIAKQHFEAIKPQMNADERGLRQGKNSFPICVHLRASAVKSFLT